MSSLQDLYQLVGIEKNASKGEIATSEELLAALNKVDSETLKSVVEIILNLYRDALARISNRATAGGSSLPSDTTYAGDASVTQFIQVLVNLDQAPVSPVPASTDPSATPAPSVSSLPASSSTEPQANTSAPTEQPNAPAVTAELVELLRERATERQIPLPFALKGSVGPAQQKRVDALRKQQSDTRNAQSQIAAPGIDVKDAARKLESILPFGVHAAKPAQTPKADAPNSTQPSAEPADPEAVTMPAPTVPSSHATTMLPSLLPAAAVTTRRADAGPVLTFLPPGNTAGSSRHVPTNYGFSTPKQGASSLPKAGFFPAPASLPVPLWQKLQTAVTEANVRYHGYHNAEDKAAYIHNRGKGESRFSRYHHGTEGMERANNFTREFMRPGSYKNQANVLISLLFDFMKTEYKSFSYHSFPSYLIDAVYEQIASESDDSNWVSIRIDTASSKGLRKDQISKCYYDKAALEQLETILYAIHEAEWTADLISRPPLPLDILK